MIRNLCCASFQSAAIWEAKSSLEYNATSAVETISTRASSSAAWRAAAFVIRNLLIARLRCLVSVRRGCVAKQQPCHQRLVRLEFRGFRRRPLLLLRSFHIAAPQAGKAGRQRLVCGEH